MRHRISVRKIGRDDAHTRSIIRNMTLSLLKFERIETTKPRAKQLKPFVEQIITKAKEDNLHHRRLVYRDLRDKRMLKKLFEDIGKRFQNRNGGYTRIYSAGYRKGDGAEICLIELVEELLSPGTPPSESPPSPDSESQMAETEKEISKPGEDPQTKTGQTDEIKRDPSPPENKEKDEDTPPASSSAEEKEK